MTRATASPATPTTWYDEPIADIVAASTEDERTYAYCLGMLRAAARGAVRRDHGALEHLAEAIALADALLAARRAGEAL